MVAFSYFSHKVLRWLGAWLLLSGFVANLFVLASPFFWWLFLGQLAFYVLGFIAPAVRAAASAAQYFIALNAGLGLGSVRFVLGLQRPFWSTTPRNGGPVHASPTPGLSEYPASDLGGQATGPAVSSRRNAA